jgi:RNA polymerase sigma factor for flagellar operon FliA
VNDREAAIHELMPLVRRLARRILRLMPAADEDDLVGDGCLGLIRAVDTFDPERHVPLASYARSVIVGAMLNGIRRRDPVSERVRRRLRRAEAERLRLAQSAGRMPTAAEMEARIPGLSGARRVAHAAACLSLDAALTHEQGGLLDFGADPARLVLERAAQRELQVAIAKLPERQRRVVMLHYYQNQPLNAIGRSMSISPQRASQLHCEAMRRLRAGFAAPP